MNKLLTVAVIAIGLISLPASANNGNHYGWIQGGHPHGGTPLPLIGAGLPGLGALIAGAYFLYRRKQRKD